MTQNRKRHAPKANRIPAGQPEDQPAAAQPAPTAPAPDAVLLERLDRLERLMRSLAHDSLESIQSQREVQLAIQQATAGFNELDTVLKYVAQTVLGASQDSQKSMQLAEEHFAAAIRELEARLRDEMQWQIFRSALLSIFPAIDDLDLIIAHQRKQTPADEFEGSILEALVMVRQKLDDGLRKLGLEEIPVEPGATTFDPALHQAVHFDATIDVICDQPAPRGTILALRRAGYRWNGKIFRSPQVVVQA